MRVDINKLRKHYGVDGISLSLEPGECLAVVGVNGAGKSTLLRCLAGLLIPEQGRILYDQQPFSRRRLDLRRRLFFIPDSPLVHPDQPVIDYLRDVLKAYNQWRPEAKTALLDCLEKFQISKQICHPFSWLSRGQIYKVAFTALLLAQAELWLLDEPFASGLDGLGMDFVRNEIRAATQRGCTVIYSTQILEIAQTLGTRIAILDRGQLKAQGTFSQLQEAANFPANLLEIMKDLRDNI